MTEYIDDELPLPSFTEVFGDGNSNTILASNDLSLASKRNLDDDLVLGLLVVLQDMNPQNVGFRMNSEDFLRGYSFLVKIGRKWLP